MKQIIKTVWCIVNEKNKIEFVGDVYNSEELVINLWLNSVLHETQPTWEYCEKLGYRARKARLIIEIPE